MSSASPPHSLPLSSPLLSLSLSQCVIFYFITHTHNKVKAMRAASPPAREAGSRCSYCLYTSPHTPQLALDHLIFFVNLETRQEDAGHSCKACKFWYQIESFGLFWCRLARTGARHTVSCEVSLAWKCYEGSHRS